MTANKLIFCLVAVAAVIIATEVNSYPQYGNFAPNNTNSSHNLIVGYRRPGDKQVLSQSVVKSSAWMQVVVVEKTFNVSKWERITQVQALDQKTNGNGAYATLLKGGPGMTNVTLRFKSQKGHGINFLVKIFAN